MDTLMEVCLECSKADWSLLPKEGDRGVYTKLQNVGPQPTGMFLSVFKKNC
jgi:hypothetical protein